MILVVVLTAMLIKSLFLITLSLATGRLPPGAALSVHRLASLQGHASLETLHPPAGQEVGQVAGAV